MEFTHNALFDGNCELILCTRLSRNAFPREYFIRVQIASNCLLLLVFILSFEVKLKKEIMMPRNNLHLNEKSPREIWWLCQFQKVFTWVRIFACSSFIFRTRLRIEVDKCDILNLLQDILSIDIPTNYHVEPMTKLLYSISYKSIITYCSKKSAKL